MPTSSADYIIRKAAQKQSVRSALRTEQVTPCRRDRSQRRQPISPLEQRQAAGWAAGAGADVVAMGGIGSWATFAKFVGIDMVMNVGMEHLNKKGKAAKRSVSRSVSAREFSVRAPTSSPHSANRQKVIKNHENSYIKATNSHFKNKIPTSNITFMDWTKQTEQTSFPWNKGTFLDPQRNEATKRTGKYKDVPLIVAPGQEDEYLEVKARLDAEAEKEKKAEPKETPDSSTEEATPSVVQQEETALQTNENGWDGLLQSFGLNGFSDIGKNLGYVLAMLPDVLVGLFTGKTKSLNMDNSLLPLASIVAGMFVKNPILKMLLMGMGGANLLNKAGHEVLGRKQQEGIAPTVSPAASRIQYRQYPDEPLNPRISNPMLQGRCLVANIDHVPCTIQLPDSVIGAHQSGALPLNTLANAILAKNDQMRQMAAMQYEEQARESVVRPRGIQ